MEKVIVYPFCQLADLTVSPPVAFDARGIWRIDSGAMQHRQRLAARKVLMGSNPTLTDLHSSEQRTD